MNPDPLTVTEDDPEGTAPLRKVRVSEALFRALGATYVRWGEPDADGFYDPVIGLVSRATATRETLKPNAARRRSGEWAVACFLLLVLLVIVAWKVSR